LQALEHGACFFFVPSTDGGANWTNYVRVNTDSTTNDQWMPAMTVRPDGNQLFIGWLDRRNDTEESDAPAHSGDDLRFRLGHLLCQLTWRKRRQPAL
jgi:hypothetical protein